MNAEKEPTQTDINFVLDKHRKGESYEEKIGKIDGVIAPVCDADRL